MGQVFSAALSTGTDASTQTFKRALRSSSRGAFSLVEIMLSLGIISFAFVGLLGLIPVGLNTAATSIDATVETQIMQRVTAVARQAKFSELPQMDRDPSKNNGEEAPDFFFDEQANEVIDPAAITARNYVYTAAVTLLKETKVPSNKATFLNPNLATLNLHIRRISAPREVRLVSLFIANNGQ
jgi:uncharacterized protein (TIGR02598 family)